MGRRSPLGIPRARAARAAFGALAGAALSGLSSLAEADPFFTDVTQVSLPSPQPCVDPETGEGEGCYTNWLALSDLDGDGDLDILLANGGGYYEVGNAEPSLVYFNDGRGAFRDVTTSSFAGAISRLRQVSIADVDGDGDLDLYQPGGYGVDADKLWIQSAAHSFADEASTRLPPGSASRAGSSHFGDLDGDGDLDLIVGDWGDASTAGVSRLVLYSNDGAGVFSVVASQGEAAASATAATALLPPTLPAEGALGSYWGRRPIDLDTADIDGDFDLDILINHRDGVSRILLNDGNATFSDGNAVQVIAGDAGAGGLVSNYPEKAGPYAYNQELCDIDADGDLDLLIDNAGPLPEGAEAGNFTQVLVNDGSGKFVDETRARVFGEPGSDDNAVKCVDMDNDGDYDLLVASLQNTSEKLLLNDGTGVFNYVADAFPLGTDPTLGIDAADLDGDGIFDVVTGQGEADPKVNRVYRGGGAALPDSLAPVFRSVRTPAPINADETLILLVAVRDGVTSETGEHLTDVSVAYTAGEASGTVPARFIGGDLYRAVIPPQPAGTTLTLTPGATDRRGNVGSATPLTVRIPSDDADAEPDASVPAPEEDLDAGVASAADAGALPAAPPVVANDRAKDDGGCSVAQPVASPRGGLAPLGLVVAAILGWAGRAKLARRASRRARA